MTSEHLSSGSDVPHDAHTHEQLMQQLADRDCGFAFSSSRSTEELRDEQM